MDRANAELHEIFCDALELASPAERAAYLDRVCGDDRDLRQRVERLLEAHAEANSFLGARPSVVAATCARPAEAAGTIIGPYKLVEQIGEGGFGVVYMAEQERPVRRKVALKIVKPGMDTRQVVARFEAERQALALMDHSNIARVFDAGTTDSGRPYFVMELVKGIPITQFCDDNRLTPRERLELFVAVCQAVQHAHQKGIIHRDLKPSNVLVTLHDGTPVVKVIDFGIAKALGQERLTDKTLCTGLAQMIGTPLYMSPEQAQMSEQDTDTRTDIYSLGVLLYELLTGTTPFDKDRLMEASFDEIRRIIRDEEPAKPSTRISTLGQAATTVSTNRKSEPKRLSQLFRGELDWIVMKALEKDRNRRYETASSFAADVQRYLHDEPVQACPPSAVYCFRKFARRNKATLTMASVIVFAAFLALAGLTISTVLVWQANTGLSDSLERERHLREQEQHNAYYQRITLAERDWSANNLSRVEQLLEDCPRDLRGWEWYYLKRLPHQTLPPLRHESMVFCVAFSPTGQYLASGSRDGVVRVWDAHTGQPFRTFRADEKMVNRVAFSPDGQSLAAACSDGHLRIWDIQADKKLPDWPAHSSSVVCVVFSPDGRRLASSCFSYGWKGKAISGEAKVWDVATRKEIVTFLGQPLGILGVAFSPDGRHIASAGEDKTVKVWETTTGRELPTCSGHTAAVDAVAFSPDGRFLSSASAAYGLARGELKLWDARTGEECCTFRGHIGFIMSCAFSPDGRRLASAGMDRTVKLWDPVTGQETLTLRGHQDWIRWVAFSPNSHELASASEDGTVRIWDATPLDKKSGEGPRTLRVHPAGVLEVGFHPDSQRLASVADDGGVKLWDSHTGKEMLTFPDSKGFWCLAFSPDGQRLATGGGYRSEIKIWDVHTGQTLQALKGFRNAVKSVAFSRNSRHLVSAHWDKTLRVWDTDTGEEQRRIDAHDYPVSSLTLSPDGKLAATASADETVKVWGIATGALIKTLERRQLARPTCVAFRPDGQLLASGSAAGTIKLWDAQTWQPRPEVLRDPTGGVESLAFSPDGRLLAWGSTDATVKIQDLQTKAIHSLRGHTSWVQGVAFSPDGKWIASASLDGTVKIWKTPPVPEPNGAADK